MRLDAIKKASSKVAGRRVTWNEIMQKLSDSHEKIPQVLLELERLRGVIEKALLKPVVLGQPTISPTFAGLSPHPPPFRGSPPPKISQDPDAKKVTGVRAELMREMRQKFRDGVKLVPMEKARDAEIFGELFRDENISSLFERGEEGKILVEEMMASIIDLASSLKKFRVELNIEYQEEYRKQKEQDEEIEVIRGDT
jgi:hypothetical protein